MALGGSSDITINENEKHIQLPAPEVGQLVATIFNNFKQKEKWEEYTKDNLPASVRQQFESTISCWCARVCNNEYTKQNAIEDVQGAVDELVANANEEFRESIDNTVHQAAKYKIPRIISDMTLSNSYDNTCAQLLMCDALEELRNLNIEGLINNAAQLRVQQIKDYLELQIGIARTHTDMIKTAQDGWESYDGHSDEHNSVAPEAALETLLVGAGSALLATILTELYQPAYEAQAAAYCSLANGTC